LGTGSLFSGLLHCAEPGHIESAVGVERDPDLANTAVALWKGHGLHVIRDDFTALEPPSGVRPNLILTNPPYVRHHHLDRNEKGRLQARSRRILGRPLSGLAGLYCYFIALADEWLASDGIAVWLVPSEFMDVNYGEALKHYLTTRVRLLQVHRFDPESS